MSNQNRTLTLTRELEPGTWKDKTIHKFADEAGKEYSVWDSDLAEKLRGYLGAEATYDVRFTEKNGKVYLSLDGVQQAPTRANAATPGGGAPMDLVTARIRIAEIASTLALVDLDPQGRVQYLLDICRAVEGFVFGTSEEPTPDW